MKITCKDCGTEFEMTESEISFYKSKGFEMPKRCKQCRDSKKGKKVSSAAGIGAGGAIGFGNVTELGKNSGSGRKNGDSGSYGYNGSGQNGRKKTNWLIVLAAIAVVAVAAILILVNVNRANDSDAVASTNTVSTAGINATEQMSDTGSTEVKSDEETDAASDAETVSDAETEDGEDTENSDGDASADGDMSAGGDMSVGDDMSAGDANSEVPAGNADDSGKESGATVSEPVSTATSYRFRNNKLLTQHYEKHGIEMGFASAADYEAAASAVINNPNALNKVEAEDGDYVYYVEATNEFVILSTDGYIRTYFLPSGGKAYYDRQ